MAPRDTLACLDLFHCGVIKHTLRSSTASLLKFASSILTFGLLPRFPCKGLGLAGDEEIVGLSLGVAGLQKLRGFTSLHRKVLLPAIASTPFHDCGKTQRSIDNQRTSLR